MSITQNNFNMYVSQCASSLRGLLQKYQRREDTLHHTHKYQKSPNTFLKCTWRFYNSTFRYVRVTKMNTIHLITLTYPNRYILHIYNHSSIRYWRSSYLDRLQNAFGVAKLSLHADFYPHGSEISISYRNNTNSKHFLKNHQYCYEFLQLTMDVLQHMAVNRCKVNTSCRIMQVIFGSIWFKKLKIPRSFAIEGIVAFVERSRCSASTNPFCSHLKIYVCGIQHLR